MELLPDLAVKIIKNIKSIINEELIVTNDQSIIIASTDNNRIGQYHEGAKNVLATNKKYIIKFEKIAILKGVKEGINLPINYKNNTIGVIGITGVPNEIEHYADLIRKFTELLIKETQLIENEKWEKRGLELYFQEWIYKDDVNKDFIRRGQLLGVPVGSPFICLYVKIKNNSDFKILNIFNYHFMKNDFILTWGENQYIIVKRWTQNLSRDTLKKQLQDWKFELEAKYSIEIAIGVSRSIAELHLQKAYREAEKAVNIVKTSKDIIFYDELLIEILLGEINNNTQQEFVQRTLEKISSNEELLNTLDIYIKNNQSIKYTAEANHIHQNTLHYRLNQIKDLTGIDPKNSEGITIFYIALYLIRL